MLFFHPALKTPGEAVLFLFFVHWNVEFICYLVLVIWNFW
jgi:hypothetical protein